MDRLMDIGLPMNRCRCGEWGSDLLATHFFVGRMPKGSGACIAGARYPRGCGKRCSDGFLPEHDLTVQNEIPSYDACLSEGFHHDRWNRGASQSVDGAGRERKIE